MKRRPEPRAPEENPPAAADAILQVKVWLTGVSPMVWRRVLVAATVTLRAAHYGSWEVGSLSPVVTLAEVLARRASFIRPQDFFKVILRRGILFRVERARLQPGHSEFAQATAWA